MDLTRKLVLALATGGYVGYMPIAPGTFGSVVGLFVYWLIAFLPLPAVFLLMAGFAAVSVWIAHQAAAILGTEDPKQVVVDEIIGMMAALFALPFHPVVWIAGFLLFRGFDIIKPFPISYLEKRCPGGLGIVIDDVVAGIFANILLRGILLFV
jgi:phosphatidylglycerophosphatase A